MKKWLAAALVLVVALGMAVGAGAGDVALTEGDSVSLSSYEHTVPEGNHEILRLEKAKDLAGEFHYDLMLPEDGWTCVEEYTLNSQFSRLTGYQFIGFVAPFGNWLTLEIFGDGARIYYLKFDPNDEESASEIRKIDIDVSGYDVLRVDLSSAAYHGFYLSNMQLHY